MIQTPQKALTLKAFWQLPATEPASEYCEILATIFDGHYLDNLQCRIAGDF